MFCIQRCIKASFKKFILFCISTLQELWGFLVAASCNKMISSKYVPDNVTTTNVHSSGYFSHQPYAPASIYQIYFTLHL
jgi:hypothetical protein